MASTTLARAASFSRGATESSRSRKVMSAGTDGPFCRKRSLEPGTDRHERRGRFRVRSDMAASLRVALETLPFEGPGGIVAAHRVEEWLRLQRLGRRQRPGPAGLPGGSHEEAGRQSVDVTALAHHSGLSAVAADGVGDDAEPGLPAG